MTSPNRLSAEVALNESDPWIVDFIAASEPFWKMKAPFLSTDLYPHVLSFCTLMQNMREEGKQMNESFRSCENGLQHGHDMYHELVALTIAFSIFLSHKLDLFLDHQRPFDVNVTSKTTSVSWNSLNNSLIRRCYGQWGVPQPSLDHRSASATDLLKELSILNNLEDLSSKPVSFQWTFGPFMHNIAAKSSYHVTEVGYPISFKLPALTVEVSIQFVAHSDVRESCVFQILLDSYCANVSTFLPGNSQQKMRFFSLFICGCAFPDGN